MGRPHRAAVASVGALLFASSDAPSFCAPPVASAFSQPVGRPASSVHAVMGGAPPSALLRSHSRAPTALAELQFIFNPKSRAALPSKSTRHAIIRLRAQPSDAADGEASTDSSNGETSKSTIKDDVANILTLVGAQALLIPISILLARYLNLPNRGLGEGFEFTSVAFTQGLEWTAPLFIVAGVMRLIEPYSEALQGVTRATQRSVLAVMGKRRRPFFALVVSILLGAVAGWGEEWLFRGVFQTLLSERFSSNVALGISGVVFGLLHAVTPVYALLAGAASVFFGYLYNLSENLAVPMICHAVYDVGALVWAHWSVTSLSNKEQEEILSSGPGAPIMNASLSGKE
ncbi:hypothetical protein ACHAXT_005994 [Thalassiosira profunda]